MLAKQQSNVRTANKNRLQGTGPCPATGRDVHTLLSANESPRITMKTTFVSEPRPVANKRHTSRGLPRAPRLIATVANASESLGRLPLLVRALLGTGRGPSVTFVYQDDQTHTWAKGVSHKIARLAGEEGVRESWWKISDLNAPGILAGAVSSALRADLIVVATRAEGLPLAFYVWVNLWWPHRSEMHGGLVALVGAAQPAAARSGRVGEYLREVTQQARMEFLTAEKLLPVGALNGQNALNGANHHSNGANGSSKVIFGRRT